MVSVYKSIDIGTRPFPVMLFVRRRRLATGQGCLATRAAGRMINRGVPNPRLVPTQALDSRELVYMAPEESHTVYIGSNKSFIHIEEFKKTLWDIIHQNIFKQKDPGEKRKLHLLKRDLFFVDSMEGFTRLLSAQSRPLFPELIEAKEELSKSIPELKYAFVFILSAESPWFNVFFRKRTEGCMFNITDETQGRSFIIIKETVKRNEFLLEVHAILHPFSGGEIRALTHEAIHIGHKLDKVSPEENEFRRILIEGYTELKAIRLYRTLSGRKKNVEPSYPRERAVVKILIAKIGLEIIEQEINNNDSFVLIPKKLGSAFKDLVAFFGAKPNKTRWISRTKKILGPK
ncbi:MAG: hypothetical protein HQ564_09195 [Candidatus Saganbacteria bacterium]|nr:hypothetical protein [Candidatus Saganbacteria bacterium]